MSLPTRDFMSSSCSRRQRLVLGLLMGSLWVGSGAAQADTASQMMSQAAKLGQTGQFDAAAKLFGRAAQAFKVQGQTTDEAKAQRQAAAMYEKQADQLLAGVKTAKTPAQAPVPHHAMAAQVRPIAARHLPPLARQSGVFKGRCTTELGKPLAKAFINIKGLTKAGAIAYTSTETDANGVYSLHLPAGIYSLYEATYPVTLGSIGYDLPLATPNGVNDMADIRPGIVRNLTLKIHGKVRPGEPDDKYNSYWGAGLRATPLDPLHFEFVAGSTVEVKLVPEGPLADGSVGKTLVLSQKNATDQNYEYWRDIPLGLYTVSARILNADGSVLTPLTIGVSRATNVYMPPDKTFAARQAHVAFPLAGGTSTPHQIPNARADTVELNLFMK